MTWRRGNAVVAAAVVAERQSGEGNWRRQWEEKGSECTGPCGDLCRTTTLGRATTCGRATKGSSAHQRLRCGIACSHTGYASTGVDRGGWAAEVAHRTCSLGVAAVLWHGSPNVRTTRIVRTSWEINLDEAPAFMVARGGGQFREEGRRTVGCHVGYFSANRERCRNKDCAKEWNETNSRDGEQLPPRAGTLIRTRRAGLEGVAAERLISTAHPVNAHQRCLSACRQAGCQ